MLVAWAAFRPQTCFSNATDAVLRCTPTALTQSSTVRSNASLSIVLFTSCWYWPSPRDTGGTFTYSANGSCNRRAIATAPRNTTSTPGSSCSASNEAEYTEAPHSDVRAYAIPGLQFNTAFSNLSTSLEPVPSPKLMSSTLHSIHKWQRLLRAVSHCRQSTTVEATNLPVGSTTTTFVPLLIPGSNPNVHLGPAGELINSPCKFLENTLMASSSARFCNFLRASTDRRFHICFHAKC
mmetsp:Transcript_74523/g.131704  ORF Transcript_74523/g.131704 Transcript_74523/m.131704 type:complete len:237 (+) Transcript_74523:1387-2097(+)